MTEQELAHLAPEERARVLALTRVFESEGWRYIEEEILERLAAASARKLQASNWEDNRVADGEMRAYATVLNMPESVEITSEDDLSAFKESLGED